MPYEKRKNHPDCPLSKPWAVVKKDDGKVMGCHASEKKADAQIAALYANEADMTSRSDLIHSFLFVELGEAGKPVEFLRTGTFIDRYGRPVTITEEDLDAYVANFAAGAAEQEVPIDVDHEKGPAAGWVKAVERIGNKLVLIPEWTTLGLELVGNKIYKYMSAFLDTVDKVIKTVSLCNLPSVKGLKPAELSEGVYTMKRMGLFQRVRDGLARIWEDVSDAELADGVPGSVRIGEYFQARIHTFFTRIADEWAAGGLLSVDERKTLSGAIGAALDAFSANVGDVGQRVISVPGPDLYYFTGAEETPKPEEVTMAKTEEEIRAEERQRVEAQLAENAKREAELREKVRGEVEAELKAKMAREASLAEFAASVCGGAQALSVPPDQVTAFLSGLTPEQVEQAKALLTAKRVDLTEHGTARDGRTGLKALDANYRGLITRYLAEDAAHTVAKYFEINHDELGEMAEYDLSEFKGK